MNFICLEEISKFKGWSFKEVYSIVATPIDDFSYSFILAISEHHFVGIMANSNSNDSNVFLHFLSNLCKTMEKEFIWNNNSYWIVMDNASIHKTSQIQKFLKNNGIYAITIPPYNPVLNVAELAIQAIKAKIKKRRSQGR